ncbi:VOC family protein [Arthrobacter sp. SO3]|uniref:VOC family protein n=1 Tax=Arthrobacter sp. SO3 TaxID=1897057 RepID=UPI00299E33FA|nr:VOC family protein [Arthrobacter sp. SO3]
MTDETRGALHHVELWVPDLGRARDEWGWLLARLGYQDFQGWPDGCSWRRGTTYIVVEESPALSGRTHDRNAPGLNHLAFSAGTQREVDALAAAAVEHGWRELFPEKYPHAGGPDHFAAYLVNSDGFEAELVATGRRRARRVLRWAPRPAQRTIRRIRTGVPASSCSAVAPSGTKPLRR